MKLKIEFQFKSFQDIHDTYKKKREQIIGNKNKSDIQEVEENRRNQMLFIEKTLELMQKEGNEEDNARALTGIIYAISSIARSQVNLWSTFADKLDEVIGTAYFDEKNKKLKHIDMPAVYEVECLTKSQQFLQYVLYKNNNIKSGKKSDHAYSDCECNSFGSSTVWNKVSELLSKANKKVDKESEQTNKMIKRIENNTNDDHKKSGVISYFWGSRKSTLPITINLHEEEQPNSDIYTGSNSYTG